MKDLLRKLLSVFFIPLFIWCLAAQQEGPQKTIPSEFEAGLKSITGSDGMSYIEFLSCNELEGRDTADRGLRIARRYITSLYKLWGIVPAGDVFRRGRSYEQGIRIDIYDKGSDAWIEVKNGPLSRKFFYASDVFTGKLQPPGTIEAAICFVGYGIHAPDLGYDDLAGIDLKNKIALLFIGVPGAENPKSPFVQPENRSRYGNFSLILKRLKKQGAAAALIISPGEMSTTTVYKYVGGGRIIPKRVRMVPANLNPEDSLPYFVVTENVANEILKNIRLDWKTAKESIDSSLTPNSEEFKDLTAIIHNEADIRVDVTANLLGMIEGSDPKLKDEIVLICAHLDHFGITEDRRVFNGADDNASGSAAVMEIAQAFALNNARPKRTILFAHWTGEERGLIGSHYFTEFPTVPLKKIVACLNLDMIGREFTSENLESWTRRFGDVKGLDGVNSENMGQLVMVSASYESPELLDIIDTCSRYLDLLSLSRACSKEYGSDELYFYRSHIPCVQFSAAMHEDYHTVEDTADKISAPKFEQITRLAYSVAEELANSNKKMSWKEK